MTKSTVKKSEAPLNFPVVGIGASAGGMEAFSSLLKSLSPDLGLAYVLVQHLSPSHESFLVPILQRETKMKVQEVREEMKLEKDHVYIIPPNKELTLVDGHFKLTPRPADAKVFHSIDIFLMTLADVYKNNAIGIILSGTGTDGTVGLKTIKNEGGITFAQDESAKYEGMPRYASDMGFVDFVMPPDKIAQELSKIIKHVPVAGEIIPAFIEKHKEDLKKIFSLIHLKKHIDFSYYKQTTIVRRITRRMLLNRMDAMAEYIKFIREDGKELDALYYDLLINVTSFFREAYLFTVLSIHILPFLLKERKTNDPVRIWIPGCSTGEEAVTFAIILMEYFGDKGINIPVQIFATDLNEKAIDRARIGVYSKAAVQNLSAERLKRFFVPTDGHYQVNKTIRDMCVFAPHNLLKDPPFSRMDIISCQNVFIYLEPDAQQKILESFHYALKLTGFLLLGKSETVGSSDNLFEMFNKNYKLYTKKQVSILPKIDFSKPDLIQRFKPNDAKKTVERKESEMENEIDKLLLSQYVFPTILANKDLEIVRFRGDITPFVHPATGKASLNLMKMVKDDIALELRSLIQQAKKKSFNVKKENVLITDGELQKLITIEVTPLYANENNLHFLIVFNVNNTLLNTKQSRLAKSPPLAKDHYISTLENRVKELQETIKAITEDFEATREELQSSGEEILSSNEELQSINEELETSKEEMQSANEELITINEELYKKNNELREMTDYADGIFETMHEALIILTDDYKVKFANKGFYAAFNVSAIDTENKYLEDLGNKQWQIPELEKMLKSVKNSFVPIVNFQVTHDFPTIGLKTMLLNAQRLSLKDGREPLILLAIQDITVRKQIEDQVKESEERFRLLVQNSFDIITIFDKNGTIQFRSASVETILGFTPEEEIGSNIFTGVPNIGEEKNSIAEIFNQSLQHPGENIRGEFKLKHKNGSYRTIDAVFLNLLNNEKIRGIVANYRDITERKAFEQQKDEFIGIASHELKTPVTSIKIYTELLHERLIEHGDKELSPLTESMNKQVDRLNRLITDLLDFTRIDGGGIKFQMEDFEINDLIREIAEIIEKTSKTHTLQLNLDNSCRINADRHRIGEVLINILSNAIKYSPDSDKVLISSKCEENTFQVCVTDFGIGIDTNSKEKVFEKFYRVEHASINTFPGLGLGLYISNEIIKKHNGKMWVRSSFKKGSTFCFSLPVKK